MKKLLSVGAGIFGAVIMTASVCSATIPQSQLSIGIGADLAALEKAYGKADLVQSDRYVYFTDDKNLGLVFKLKNGQVYKIKCGFLHKDGKRDSKSKKQIGEN